MTQAKSSLDSLYQALRDNPVKEKINSITLADLTILDYPESVVHPLMDDLNSPMALAAMHDLAATLQKTTSPEEAYAAKLSLLAGGKLLGLLKKDPEEYFKAESAGDSLSPDEIELLIAERNTARTEKNFGRADEIRQELSDLGIELEDLRGETRWRKT